MKKVSFIITAIAITSFSYLVGCKKDSNDSAIVKNASEVAVGPSQGDPCAVASVNVQSAELAASGGGNFNPLNITAAYEFRDDFLATSSRGKLYIVDYYAIGAFAFSNNIINISTLGEFHDFLNLGINVGQKIMHGSPSDIIIDQNAYNQIKTELEKIRNNPNSIQIAPILKTLETDLELMKFKNKTEVVNFLKS